MSSMSQAEFTNCAATPSTVSRPLRLQQNPSLTHAKTLRARFFPQTRPGIIPPDRVGTPALPPKLPHGPEPKFALIYNEPIGPQIGEIPPDGKYTWRQIVKQTALKYRVKAEDILSDNRSHAFLIPRQECMYRMRTELT